LMLCWGRPSWQACDNAAVFKGGQLTTDTNH